MAQRYLITGCAGFIASKVAQLLLDAGHEVVGVDDLNDSTDPRLKRWRLERLRARKGFHYHHQDICERAGLEALFEADGRGRARPYDALLNLAARVGVRASVEDPWIYQRVNTEGTLNLLDLCRRHAVPKFVLASTSSLYGAHNPVPYSEEADTSRPLSPYAASKKGAEALAYSYHHLYQLDVSVVRYFTVYGPAGRPDMSVFRFIRRIALGEPLYVFGDGHQQRDFTYVDDIARGTIAALRPLGFEVLNLGGDQPVSVLQLIERISGLVRQRARIEHRPAHAADVSATWANVEKAGRLLGWRAEIGLEEGLRRTVEWFQQNRQLALSVDTRE